MNSARTGLYSSKSEVSRTVCSLLVRCNSIQCWELCQPRICALWKAIVQNYLLSLPSLFHHELLWRNGFSFFLLGNIHQRQRTLLNSY